MLVAHIDESYSHLAMSVACIVIDESQINGLTIELSDIVSATSRSFPAIQSTSELHTYQLVAGRGEWAGLAGHLRIRAAIFRSALEVIEQRVTQILVERIVPGPRRGTSSARTMHIEVVRDLLARLEAHVAGKGERCLVLVDEVSYRDDLRTAVDHGMRPRLLDTVHFTESRVSRPMQSADLCAYLGRRYRPGAVTAQGKPVLDAWLWQAIASKVSLVHHEA